ncbi:MULTISPECIES: SpoIIE family protein phosphatase [unclassified Micromonospora]|uniref:SpoIIE family protein phosphatase n=1 Tax=unclassified Micromonospora TaxID=2617518 RepID=UPI003320D363
MAEANQRWSSGDPRKVLEAFEQLPGFVWVFEGPDLRVVAANPEVRAAVGNRSALIGEPFKQAVPELAGQHIFELLDQALRGTRTQGYEQRILTDRHGDGKLEETFYTFDIAPWRDPGGSIHGVIVQAVDATDVVTARRATESAATTSEQRYRRAAGLILELQRSLLPEVLPVLPRVQVAAHYLVAGSDLVAGGDWFDVVPLPDDRIALAVGDIVGHGAAAAAAMGQLRSVALHALRSGSTLSQTLAVLDDFAGHSTATRAATTCIAVLHPVTGTLEVASHAHPPPLLVDAAGNTTFMPLTPASPLGTRSVPATVHTTRLAPGDVVLLYTDGLIERPHRSLREGAHSLATAASAARHDSLHENTSVPDRLPDRICTLVTERLMLADGGYRDDITILAAYLLPEPVTPLHLTLPAEPTALRPLRRQLTEWLNTIGASAHDTSDLIHAVGEAAGNAIEHADASDTPAAFSVDAVLDDDGVVHLTCADRGRWRPALPDPGRRGRGLAMVRGLVDHLEVVRTDVGTSLRMHHRLGRPTIVTSGAVHPRATRRRDPAVDEISVHVIENPDGKTLEVHGPVDMVTTSRLRAAILQANRGGALPLTIDVSAVSHLSSAGVQLLHHLAADLDRLRVAAEPGSPAEAVLTLTGLQDLLTRPASGEVGPKLE